MELNEALRTVQKMGRGNEATQLLEQAAQNAEASYKRINADKTISDSHRLHLLARVYKEHETKLADQLSTIAAKSIRADRDDAERVLGVRGLPGDAASLAISRRDAGDRVASITDSRELMALLQRATRNGDEILARAATERAIEIGDAVAVNQFTADRPDLLDATERLWAAQHATNNGAINGLINGGLLAALRPQQLATTSTYGIQQLADTEQQPAPQPQPVFTRPSYFVQQPAGFVQGEVTDPPA